jgi:hypothetical protein
MTRAQEAPKRPLWQCGLCGRCFANRNQSHACGSHDVESHFQGKPDWLREAFEQFVALARSCGPFTVLPQKTRIAFQARMSFAAVCVRRNCLAGHFVLARRLPHRRFSRIETISPRNHVHHFRIVRFEDLDAEFLLWLQEAYAVGQQEHLGTAPRKPTAGTGRTRRR